jgi:hypothetical protein
MLCLCGFSFHFPVLGVLCLSSLYALAPATDARCRSVPWLLGLGFMFLISSLFAKLFRVMKIFNQKKMKVCVIRGLCGHALICVCPLWLSLNVLCISLYSE